MERLLGLTDYLNAFLDDMRMYTRATTEERKPVNVGSVIRQAMGIARKGLLDAGIDTVAVIDEVVVPRVLRAPLYPRQTTTALLHLLRNGLEALAEAAMEDERRLIVRACSDGAGGVLIEVEDNGPGIDPETLQALLAFMPGKTTRKCRGTGFGLPTANRIAVAHGGSLGIASQLGRDSIFTMTLPAGEDDRV